LSKNEFLVHGGGTAPTSSGAEIDKNHLMVSSEGPLYVKTNQAAGGGILNRKAKESSIGHKIKSYQLSLGLQMTSNTTIQQLDGMLPFQHRLFMNHLAKRKQKMI
jgi:hypothetical protein